MIAFIWILLSYLLIHCNFNNYTHSDPEKDARGVYKKGYIVEVRDDDQPTGSKEGLPRFIRVNITDATKVEVEAMIVSVFGETSIMQSWIRKMDWSAVQLSLQLDAWEVTIFTVNPGATLKGLITRDMVENFITKWNGINIETFGNTVVFDVCIYEAQGNQGAVRSEGFRCLANVSREVCNELSYNRGTGIHTIEADYSALAVSPDKVEDRVIEKGGEIISHVGSVITFTIHRSNVLDEFKREVRESVEKTVYRRQFKIAESDVDTIIGLGGVRDVTLAQLQTYLINMLGEDL